MLKTKDEYNKRLLEIVSDSFYPCAKCNEPVRIGALSCSFCETFNPDCDQDPNDPNNEGSGIYLSPEYLRNRLYKE